MGESVTQVRGWVRDGTVILEPGTALPDGTEVTVTPVAAPGYPPGVIPFTPEEQAEFDMWERTSDEDWAKIDWGEGEIARDAG